MGSDDQEGKRHGGLRFDEVPSICFEEVREGLQRLGHLALSAA